MVNVNNQRNSLHVSDIKIVSLNVCGLCSKLRTPDFLEFINEHDIVCLTETKTDCADVIDVENYTVISKHRSNLSSHKSGGIVVYVPVLYLKTKTKTKSPRLACVINTSGIPVTPVSRDSLLPAILKWWTFV